MIKNFKFQISNFKSGFTLIELLIAVSIISVISVVGIVAYNAIIKSAHDSRRQADLKSVQTALEQYYADHFHYPVKGGSCVDGTLTFNLKCPLKSTDGKKIYINTIPDDTNPGKQYDYIPYAPGTSLCATERECIRYCLYANLDISPAGVLPSQCPANTGYNYAVSPL